ncbi:hypothetical protein P9D43_24495 [Neobacillus niacini]|uniref:hypothetical protein n=1 Tax=Neobacillus niacini TaxID=86668 RepID=UPI0007AB6057|nr:hypothetical protein [Neobacillus niacini]MEC1525172.1 hypothetical protein [Neobacillus niacini]
MNLYGGGMIKVNEQKQYRHDLLEWCHETAKNLSEQMELLYQEINLDQKESEVNYVSRVDMEEQIQLEEEELEPNAFQVDLEIETETEQYIDMEELNQYREDLLEWCNNLYSTWNSTKPILAKHVDNASLEGWEGMCSRLKEKLEEDLSLEYEDYEIANALYEQWEKLLEESYSYQEGAGV